jgi:hypothetical protein
MNGIYHFLINASGINYKGIPFTSEQILTGSIFIGGNNPLTVVNPFGNSNNGVKQDCCTK